MRATRKNRVCGWGVSESNSNAAERREILFAGRVQGVGFRYTTREIAARFAVRGYVQNRPDGRVLLVVEGTPDEIGRFVDELAAEMDRYIEGRQTTVLPAQHEFTTFDVRR